MHARRSNLVVVIVITSLTLPPHSIPSRLELDKTIALILFRTSGLDHSIYAAYRSLSMP